MTKIGCKYYPEAFWAPFGHFEGGSGPPNSFFSRLGECWSVFLLSDEFWGRFLVAFGPTFGGSERHFLSSLLVRTCIFNFGGGEQLWSLRSALLTCTRGILLPS